MEFRTLWECKRCQAYWSRLGGWLGSRDYYRDKPESDHLQLEGGRQRFRRVRRMVEDALGQRTYRLLDVGCAGGAHFEVYDERVEKFGIEPALSSRPSIERRGATWLGPSLDAAPAAQFDVVTCLDVLEHLEAPRPLLDGIDRCLRPGGILALVTGDIESFSARWSRRRWVYYALPEHCSFFSARALQRYLSSQYGYEPMRKTWIANKDVDWSYIRSFGRGIAREAVFKVLPPERTRAIEDSARGRFPFFCDNMLLIFRKPA